MTFKDDIINVLCNTCDDHFCKRNDDDNAKQTYGCRHTNPDICGSSYINNVCAFASEDKICKKPSAKWKKIYYLLKREEA